MGNLVGWLLILRARSQNMICLLIIWLLKEVVAKILMYLKKERSKDVKEKRITWIQQNSNIQMILFQIIKIWKNKIY